MRRAAWSALAVLVASSFVSCTRDGAVADAGVGGASGDAAVVSSPVLPAEKVAAPPESRERAPGMVREQVSVSLDGADESWRLEWARPPFPACRGADAESCICAGFAPGERGDVDLVRQRPGGAEERMPLSPLFDDHETMLATTAHVLTLGDYDHDGRASEIVLQVGAGPCGHTSTIVVGVSKANPKLHAFTSAEDARTPLALDGRRDWETVRTNGALERVQIACGDHGATESTAVSVRASGGALHATKKTSPCPP